MTTYAITLLAAVVFSQPGKSPRTYIALPYAGTNQITGEVVYNLATNSPETRAECGWYDLIDHRPVPVSNEVYVAGRVRKSDFSLAYERLYNVRYRKTKPRKFSKLKIYGAIVALPERNGVTAWEAVKTWLEAKEVGGVNGWTAFSLAQEISEDHPLFSPLAAEAKELLGLTDDQFKSLLNECILDE